MAMLADAAGVRVAPVIFSGSFDNGAGMLVQRWIPSAVALDQVPEPLDSVLLHDIWYQLALLHRAGIAHRDLERKTIVVDGAGLPWLVDFARAEAAAGPELRRRDVEDLLALVSSDDDDAPALVRASERPS